MNDNTSDFVGDCGECTTKYYSAICADGMPLNYSATVNGAAPDGCVIANDSAKVFNIELQTVAGIYDYQVRVEAQGPSGAGSGYMYLAFKDQTGHVYYLSIWSSRREWHTVAFYSDPNPTITAIYWSNYSFTVETGNSDQSKPSFQVVSPANPLE